MKSPKLSQTRSRLSQGLKLSLFVKCIESEFTDSAKYLSQILSLTQGLISLFMKPAPEIKSYNKGQARVQFVWLSM